MTRINVLVVEDHAFTLATVVGSLQGRGFSVQASNTARGALELIEEHSFDVAVLDLDLGVGPTGIDLALELRERVPNIGIIILTSYRDPRLAGHELKGIPKGGVYLCKSDITDIKVLVQSIEAVHRLPTAARQRSDFITGPTAELTDSQVEILLLIGSGATTREIAQRRGVSESAIEQMMMRICERLQIRKTDGMNQRVQLVQALNQLRGQVIEGPRAN